MYNKNEGKTKEIQKLINNLMPSFKTLLQNSDTAEGILSILCLILERDENFITIYKFVEFQFFFTNTFY